MRAGKIIASHRHGKGRTSVHALTPMRPGPVGEIGTAAAADQYVDVFPVVSLAGMKPDRMRSPRANTMKAVDESHIQKRTNGKTSRSIDSLTPYAEHTKKGSY